MPIKNEFHSRLRFNRRGLVGMATNEGSDNNMEFFFTLDQTPELQQKNTIFGKVSGETIYNMIKLNDSQTDPNDRVVYPHKINKVKILHNPFEDITPRIEKIKSKDDDASESKKKSKREGVKNFKLISFGDEAEQDEIETVKSATKKKVDVPPPLPSSSPSSSSSSKKEKRKRESKSKSPPPRKSSPPPRSSSKSKDKKQATVVNDEDSDSDYEESKKRKQTAEHDRKRKEIQDQIKDIKKQYHKDKKEKTKAKEDEDLLPKQSNENVVIKDYLNDKEKYKNQVFPAKGASRESFTLALLAKFKNKLQSATEATAEKEKQNSDDETENWLGHKLDFSDSQAAVLAKDASTKQDDWYSIYDPRNPLNKRKRKAEAKESSKSMNKK